MSELVIRRALRGDVEAMVRLLADDVLGVSREDLGPPLPAAYFAAFDAIDRDANQELLVGEQDGRIVATLQITYLPYLSRGGAWRALVESVHVASGLRSAGLGARLMQDAIARARARGCGLVQLTTDKRRPDARRFYERLGFEATHEGMKLFL